MTDIDYGQLEPVRQLREWGFTTADSGDGVSKADLIADGCALDVPHVFIRCEPAELIADARLLEASLKSVGICVEPIGRSPIFIQATYDPVDDSASLGLLRRDG